LDPSLDLELIERDAYADMYAAAPATVRSELGIAHRPVDGGMLLMCRGIDHIQFNGLAAYGLSHPPDPEAFDAAIGAFAQAGLKNWIVHVPPAAAALRDLCIARGLQPHARSWAKFHRSVAPASAQTQLSIREATREDADRFGAVAAQAFGLPPSVGHWLAALVARPGWHCFLAFDGQVAAAAGALFTDGASGWIGIGGTLPAHRRSGAQSALLATRIRKAAELGCTRVTTETGVPHAGEKGPSYDNIRRAGFEIAYVRANYTKSG
jgi:GNAT superfamily N-acetyltransferase